MTAPSADTIEREKDKLYVTDAEMIRRLGVPEPIARQALKMFDEDPGLGFPKKQKLWGDRRYWPAVKRFLDRLNGLESPIGAARLAAERPDRTGPPRRPFPAEPPRRASNDRSS